MSPHSSSFLRRALAIDAIGSGAMAALLILAGGPLSGLLGLPASLFTTAGLVLAPWTAWVGWLASRQEPPRAQVWAVIGLNALWVIESTVLLFTGSYALTDLGIAFIIVQAIAVGIFAELEFIGVRRASLASA